MTRAWVASAVLAAALSAGCAAEVPVPSIAAPAATQPPLQPVVPPSSYLTVPFEQPVSWPSGDVVKVETPQQYFDEGRPYWAALVCVSPGASSRFSDYAVEMYSDRTMFSPVSLPGISGDTSGPIAAHESRCERMVFKPDTESAKPASVALFGVGARDVSRPYTVFTGEVL